MKTLYVRIQKKQSAARFFRCGIEFTKAWKKLEEVDEATAKRLEEEQMLEVSETQPADLENEVPKTNEGQDGQAPPESPAVRLEAIRAAIVQLNKEDATLWTAGGKPKTEAIAAITGWPVTAAERDTAVEEGAQ